MPSNGTKTTLRNTLRVSFLCAFTATGAGLCVLVALKLARATGLL